MTLPPLATSSSSNFVPWITISPLELSYEARATVDVGAIRSLTTTLPSTEATVPVSSVSGRPSTFRCRLAPSPRILVGFNALALLSNSNILTFTAAAFGPVFCPCTKMILSTDGSVPLGSLVSIVVTALVELLP